MLTDYFNLAIKSLKRRKLRSWLTLIGIIISVAVIFILLSLSLGLQDAVQEQFRLLGTDKFFVQAKGSFGPPGSTGAVELTTNDVDEIKKVAGVKRVSYMVAGNAKIEFDKSIRYFMIMGIPAEDLALYMESGSMTIEEGKTLEDKDINKVIVGYDFKYNNIFPKQLNAGDKILLNDVEFKVKGIISKIGNPQDDKNIMMGINDFRSMFNSGNRVDYIIVQIDEGEDLKEVADKVEKRLIKFRNTDEKNQDFTILTPEEILTSFKSILSIITAFLISVASISLLVGAIGIANTMYTSVLERTKEIGVMKAIGAKNSDILSIFVIESGLIGVVGGVLGVVLGIIVSKLVEFIAVYQFNTDLLKAAIPIYLIAGCIFFSFIIGAVSGILPAIQASKLKPVDALRYE